MSETMAFLGCSRGLGQAVTQDIFQRRPETRALLVARTTDALKDLASKSQSGNQILTLDFAKEESLSQLLRWISTEKPERVFYFAGGGPYGKFGQKNWKDHQWALDVSFLFPAKLLHALLQNEFQFVKQIILVGSQIADDKGDPQASSYAASKHALMGLVSSILAEGTDKDIRLFRPGYMDTDLLPKNAKPREKAENLMSPQLAAEKFVTWALDANGEAIFSL